MSTFRQDSLAEKIIAPAAHHYAQCDGRWKLARLGLSDVATAASLRDNVLVPLLSSGRMLGYFQVGHHTRGVVSFTQRNSA
jgi:hypothetical protein